MAPRRAKITWNKRKNYAAYKIQTAFRARRNRRINLNARIKSIQLRNCETKRSYQRLSPGTSAQELFHNVTHYYTNLMETTQGVDNPQGNTQDSNQRIGNEIIARGMKIKLLVMSNVDRPNLNVHIYLFKYNTTYHMSDALFWAGPVGVGADSNRLLDHPNTDRVSTVRKLIIQNRVNYGNTQHYNRVSTVYREIYVPFKNWKVKYDNDTGGGKFPMYKDIGLAVVAYDTPDTNELQSVARVTAQTCLYFKDP